MSLADTYHDDLRESLDHLGRPRNHRRPGEQPSQATQIIRSCLSSDHRRAPRRARATRLTPQRCSTIGGRAGARGVCGAVSRAVPDAGRVLDSGRALFLGRGVRADPVAQARLVVRHPRAARQRTAVHRGVSADRLDRAGAGRRRPRLAGRRARRCRAARAGRPGGRGLPRAARGCGVAQRGQAEAAVGRILRARSSRAGPAWSGCATWPTATGGTARWTCTTAATAGSARSCCTCMGAAVNQAVEQFTARVSASPEVNLRDWQPAQDS